MSATIAGYKRRQDDWDHQAELATKELEQVKQQILAAEARVAIAEKDLENHDLQIEHTEEVDDFMRDKFTNAELYDWMVGQLSALYFQSYQLAYDMAKRAERSFRFELADPAATFVNFGYWDSLKKGLLAGELLHQDLRRMEVAYLDQNRREYEITKHISLAMLDPQALIMLKETGQCFMTLPEALFDTDFPGHFLRRIKSVSLSIPCVAGPYTSVNCTLTLLWNSVRQNSRATDGSDYPRDPRKPSDPRFRDSVGAIQSMVTSSGQNDSGAFELNLRDERYLWCEGAGVISDWRMELPLDTNAFDFDTITDVILHLRYTARDGGETLKTAAWAATFGHSNQITPPRKEPAAAITKPQSRRHMFSAKQAFPADWYRFLHPTTEQVPILTLNLADDHFPFHHGTPIKLNQISVVLIPNDRAADISSLELSLAPQGAGQVKGVKVATNPNIGGLPSAVFIDGAIGIQELRVAVGTLPELEDIVLICDY
jgi:hypothetical protein